MAPRTWARWKLVGKLGLAALALYAMFRWFEYKQVYQPYRDWWANPATLNRPWEDLRLTTADGVELSAWFFPATTHSPRRALAALICHGNGGNISHRLDLYQGLLGAGVNVLAFDYRGYGKSAGRPTEEGTYRDAEAAYDWLIARGFTGSNIVAFGESLGGAVAAELACRRPVAGLVLQSTFTSVPDLGAELFPFLPVRWLATIRYDTLSKLPTIRVPLLVMHSREDRLVPFRHAERNLAAAHEPKRLWEIAGDHNDTFETDPRAFAAGLETFFAQLRPTSAPAVTVAPSPRP